MIPLDRTFTFIFLYSFLSFSPMLIARFCHAPARLRLTFWQLFHVGGLLRNLLAPLLLSSSTILLPSFSPTTFYSALAHGGTWYYAGPALHKAICDSKPAGSENKLRMVANASGPLTGELATRIKDVLGSSSKTELIVLPSCGSIVGFFKFWLRC